MEGKSKIKHFKDLIVWQEAHKLVLTIYKITKNIPREEVFGIISQLRRAATSITANIAEGFGRFSYKDKVRFYFQSRGSVLELEDHLLTIKDLKYITEIDFQQSWDQSEKVNTMINGFINSTKKLINNSNY